MLVIHLTTFLEALHAHYHTTSTSTSSTSTSTSTSTTTAHAGTDRAGVSPTPQPKNDPPLLGSWNKHTGSCDDPALDDLLFLLVDDHQVVAVQFGGLFDDHVLLRDGVVVTEHRTGGRAVYG